MDQQHYCLRWKYHRSNLQVMFSQLLGRGCFCDVTLACEGQTIRAHRVILCACSTYFENLLTNCYSEEKDPIIIMHDARYEDVKCLIEFMYKGEINVEHGALTSLLKTAEELRIKGLAEVSWQEGYDDSFDYGAASNGRVSVCDGTASSTSSSSSSSAAIVEMSDQNHGETCEALDSVATVLSSAPSPVPDEKQPTLSPNSDAVCISNSQDTSHKHTNDSSSSRNADRACSIQSSVANSDTSSDSKISLSARTVGNSRLQNQEMHTPMPTPDMDFFRSAAAVSKHSAPQSASGFTPTAKHSLGNSLVGVKRKRGRPPLDKEYKTFQSLPKLTQIERTIFPPFDANMAAAAIGPAGQDPTGIRCNVHVFGAHGGTSCSVPLTFPLAGNRSLTPTSSDESFIQQAWDAKLTAELAPSQMPESARPSAFDSFEEQPPPGLNESVQLTPSEQEQWKDVVKMSDYLAKGRRPQFWEEPFTKRVMDGINSKTLEMKKAAKILGVSYGTLYGRYRETYGCLKHPYKGSFMTVGTRMQDMWHTSSSNVNISDIVSRIQQDRIASSRAAELLSNSSSAILSYLDHQQEQTTHTNTPTGCPQLLPHEEQDQ